MYKFQEETVLYKLYDTISSITNIDLFWWQDSFMEKQKQSSYNTTTLMIEIGDCQSIEHNQQMAVPGWVHQQVRYISKVQNEQWPTPQ